MNAMSARHLEIFEMIRADLTGRMAGLGAAPSGGASPVTSPRSGEGGGAAPFDAGHVTSLLSVMQRFMSGAGLDRYRDSVRRWTVMRLGEMASPESILHALTAVGDAATGLARERLGYGPEADAFAREVARASFWGTRVAVEVLGQELELRARAHGGGAGEGGFG